MFTAYPLVWRCRGDGFAWQPADSTDRTSYYRLNDAEIGSASTPRLLHSCHGSSPTGWSRPASESWINCGERTALFGPQLRDRAIQCGAPGIGELVAHHVLDESAVQVRALDLVGAPFDPVQLAIYTIQRKAVRTARERHVWERHMSPPPEPG